MRIEWQIAFWLLMLALVGFGVYLFANVLTPFIAALALGYVLDPIADRLQKLGMSRVFATLIILAFFILLLMIVASALPLAEISHMLSTARILSMFFSVILNMLITSFCFMFGHHPKED